MNDRVPPLAEAWHWPGPMQTYAPVLQPKAGGPQGCAGYLPRPFGDRLLRPRHHQAANGTYRDYSRGVAPVGHVRPFARSSLSGAVLPPVSLKKVVLSRADWPPWHGSVPGPSPFPAPPGTHRVGP